MKKVWTVFWCFAVLIAFGWGFMSGSLGLPPYTSLKPLKRYVQAFRGEVSHYDTFEDRQLLSIAFGDPLPSHVTLANPALRNLGDLAHELEKLRTVRNEDYFQAYGKLRIGPSRSPVEGILEIPYRLAEVEGDAFSYFVPSINEAPRCGVLLVPGSGNNQATAILAGKGYHGDIASMLSEYCDVYVLIKPNHDYRSIHNGKTKLNNNFLKIGLLRHGYSYSVTYLTEGLAFAKLLSDKYETWGISGLSQGGFAAFLLSLQAEPDFSIVASGFSLIQWRTTYAGFGQIMIPDLYNVYSKAKIDSILRAQKTKYLFSYGRKESAIYGIEAKSRETCGFVESIDPDRINCVVHSAGHKFPTDEIRGLLENLVSMGTMKGSHDGG